VGGQCEDPSNRREAPNFEEVYPLGNPQYSNTNSNGVAGPTAAAGWSFEATLDIEWAYSIAPAAHIVLLAVPPAESVGVQGFPNQFKAISDEIAATPPGTVFSMSFASAEQDFGGAAQAQVAKFDQVFQQGLAKDDNFFGAAGDGGTANAAKQAGGRAHHRVPHRRVARNFPRTWCRSVEPSSRTAGCGTRPTMTPSTPTAP
jgi:subtilase family serine protease